MNLDAGVELPIDACEGPCKCVLSGIQSRQRRTSAHEHDAVLEESLGCRGGIENPIGILLVGIGLGIAEFVAAAINASFRDAATFLILILLLAWRPQGLFQRVTAEKV